MSACQRVLCILAMMMSHSVRLAGQNDIGFVEDFVLSPDRESTLESLLPGTDDYYFFHCLYHQALNQHEDVQKWMKDWVRAYPNSYRLTTIRHRDALLRFDQNPELAFDYLKRTLGLSFDAMSDTPPEIGSYPSVIDPSLITLEAFTRDGLRFQDLSRFSGDLYPWLLRQEIGSDLRHEVLVRLNRPDIFDLSKHIIEDLHTRRSDFGSLSIHSRLTRAQLDSCLTLDPILITNAAFVETYASRINQEMGLNSLQETRSQRVERLSELWRFVETIPASFNSLRAHVLYHLLDARRQLGHYDPALFSAYLNLPRIDHLVPQARIRTVPIASRVDQQRQYSAITQERPIGRDHDLIVDYLHQILRDAPSFEFLRGVLDERFLKREFATAKILSGLGDPKEWLSYLTPEEFDALRQRVDVEFALTNTDQFGSAQPVALELYLKNVPTLIIKIYEINALSYYKEHLEDVPTDIDLDGLIPNKEIVRTFELPPTQRMRQRFEFPSIDHPGLFAIDFIGNGRSSRALVHRGHLTLSERTSSAGHVLHVFDEKGSLVPTAHIHLGDREFSPDANGAITIPYSTAPKSDSLIITSGSLASLHAFNHLAESTRLSTDVFVDQQSLISGHQAKAIIRTSLRIGQRRASVSLLRNERIRITAQTVDGTKTTIDHDDVEFEDDRELEVSFTVPERLSSLQIQTLADIEQLSTGETIELGDSSTISVQGLQYTPSTEFLYLTRNEMGYSFELLGRNGEAREGRIVSVQLKHFGCTHPIGLTCQTNALGRVNLGRLKDIEEISATYAPTGTAAQQYSWNLSTRSSQHSDTIHALTSETIRIPVEARMSQPLSDQVSLYRASQGHFIFDMRDHISARTGYLELTGLEPGDYVLYKNRTSSPVHILVMDGTVVDEVLINAHSHADYSSQKPLIISSTRFENGSLNIALQNASASTRVHLLATDFVPMSSPGDSLRAHSDSLNHEVLFSKETLFTGGRILSDEFRYVLDRQYAKKFPGNMLEKPSLLLNPWSTQDTSVSGEDLRMGASRGGAARAGARAGGGPSSPAPQEPKQHALGFEFLSHGSWLISNARPDADGTLVIELPDLHSRQHLHVIASDIQSLAYHDIALRDTPRTTRDLRLRKALDPNAHFVQKDSAEIVLAGETIELPKSTMIRAQEIDSLADVFQYFMSPSAAGTQLTKFNFLLDWPTLSIEKKRELYSLHACHELHLFLSRRDRGFFDEAIRPFLANKKDKTFIDLWLLDGDLTEFVEPWQFSKLNGLEKALLSRRLKTRATSIRVRMGWELESHAPSSKKLMDHFDELLSMASLSKNKDQALFKNAPSATLGLDMETTRESSTASRGLIRDRAAGERARAETRFEGAWAADDQRRKRSLGFFRALASTREWAESDYYRIRREDSTSQLIPINAFWHDLANHDGSTPFLSSNFLLAHSNLNEMLAVLAILDLPLKDPGEMRIQSSDESLTLTAISPTMLFLRQLSPSPESDSSEELLMSESFVNPSERHTSESGSQREKLVRDEFLVHTLYEGRAVVTNSGPSTRSVESLVQIPAGAIPCAGSRYMENNPFDLGPYSTKRLVYYFYFPEPGDFSHLPSQVNEAGKVLARAESQSFHVVERPSKVDMTTWKYIARSGEANEIVTYLADKNVQQVELWRILPRLKDRQIYSVLTAFLREKLYYDHDVWSYSIYHKELVGTQEFLPHSNDFVQTCGPFLSSVPLSIDPSERTWYEHLEYRPMISARTHSVGGSHAILNERLKLQYTRLLESLAYKPSMNDEDSLAITYYLLLQNRVAEALEIFGDVSRDGIETDLQYDYLASYLSLFREDLKTAGDLAARYATYPIDHWRIPFVEILNQIREISQGATSIESDEAIGVSPPLASFDFFVESDTVKISYQGLDSLDINYYLMDIELLFSQNPFISQDQKRASYIKPNLVETIELETQAGSTEWELPASLKNQNLLVELIGGSSRRTVPYFAHSLSAQIMANRGELRVSDAETETPLPKVYIKVYGRSQDGTISFHKDGYTDLRGRFDYNSVSRSDLASPIERLAILILSEGKGAIVREVNPPKS